MESASFAKFLLADVIGDALYFPFWWYSRGLLRFLKAVWGWLRNLAARLGLGVWTRYLFTPMFGQYDVAGRIISFFVRVFQILFRSVLMLAAVCVAAVVLAFYLALPIFVAWQIMRQFVLFFYAQ
ncbi:MAG: hypothetical protein AAB562_01250 [Patescibacteria group bacterium]